MNCEILHNQPGLDEIYGMHFSDDSAGGPSPHIETDKGEMTSVDRALCAKIASSKQGEKFQKLFTGDINGYDSPSNADLAFCDILAFWTGRDSRAIDRFVRASDLYRPKWDEKRGNQTYGQMTITKAIADCKETYQGSNSSAYKDFFNEQATGKFDSKQSLFVHVGELLNNIKPTDWLIEGVLEAEALSVMFGEPGSYKSFMALSWALSIATGKEWFGHKVKQGPVFMFIGEGHSGCAKRIAAWVIGAETEVQNAQVYISTAPVQMLDIESAQRAAEAITSLIELYGKPALVIFDTLARNFGPGDENSTADMTRFIATLDTCIGNDFTRLLIHHTGHGDKSRGRGSSVLKAAVDAEYRLAVQDKNITLSCEKMKDAERFKPLSFKPEIVTVGGDLLDPITSVYLNQTAWQPAATTEKLSPQMRQALSLLDLMAKNEPEKCLNCTDTWKAMCIEEEVYTRTAFYTAIKTLEERKIIEITGDYVCRL